MNLDDFLAKCPSCGTKLTIDEMGCEHCRKCDNGFRDLGDYMGAANLSKRVMDELDCKILIIPSKKLAELEKILSCSESETK